MEAKKPLPLPLLAFNHVSRVCTDLQASYKFYSEVLGFTPVKRPTSFEFEGAWLFSYGVGLHLIKGCPPVRPSKIDPKACHISFQAVSLEAVEGSLALWGIHYVKNVFVEDGIQVGQLFFHDPDNNMIEVCNCDELPVIPLTEGNLACALRPLATASPQSAGTQLSAAPSSDAGSDDSIQAAFDADRLDSDISAASGLMSAVSLRNHLNLGDSGMSGVMMATDAFNMSMCGPELDDWPSMAAAGPNISSAGPSDFVFDRKHRLAQS